jgi:hypothetical protein
MRADAVPNAASPPRHARTMRFSQTAGRVSSNTPAPPHPSAASGVKRPDRARATVAERHNGRGPTNRDNNIELPSMPHRVCYYCRGRDIFSTDGFQPKTGCQRPPPPGHCSREALFYTAGPSLRRGDSLAQSRKHLRHPSIASRGGADRARWLRRVSAFRLPSAAGLVPQEGIPIVTQWAKWILLATAIL